MAITQTPTRDHLRSLAAQLDAVAAEIIIERWFDRDLPTFSY